MAKDPLEFTGERFLPEVAGQIAFEHLHRYHFAAPLVRGFDVLDVACGEGYGSDILSNVAKSVVGVDIAAEAVAHATARYGAENLHFVEASAASLPFPDACFDAVVSFETIEHHDKHEEMMSEIHRVLRPGGILIVSSPNKLHYSVETGYRNPYHVKELFREEFIELAKRHFSHVALFGQRVVHGSLMVHSGQEVTGGVRNLRLDKGALLEESELARPLYDVLVATDGDLPDMSSSLFEVTVHGMDAAGFYGVHLPERVNTADQRIGVLESELTDARLNALSAAEVSDRIQQVDERLSALVEATDVEARSRRQELEQARQQALDHARQQDGKLNRLLEAGEADVSSRQREIEYVQQLDGKLDRLLEANEAGVSSRQHEMESVQQLNGKLDVLLRAHEVEAQLNADIERLRVELGAMREELAASGRSLEALSESKAGLEIAKKELEFRLEASDADSARKDEELREVRQLLSSRENSIEEIYNSSSWRWTAWVRAISRLLRGER